MTSKVALVTGASSGIGLGIARTLIERGYAVVAKSREVSRKGTLTPSASLVLLDGDVGDPGTATRAVGEAVSRFGKLDLLVNNAGIFIAKPFTEYTSDDDEKLISTNLAGFAHMTQVALRQSPFAYPYFTQELVCRSHPKERPHIRKALPGRSRERKVDLTSSVLSRDLRGRSVARREMDR